MPLGRLKQIKINGYKSIRELDLELGPLNILIGPNGVGKSNFIGFFKFMKKILDKDLQLYTSQQGGANKLLHFGRKTTEKISFGLYFPPNAYACDLISDTNDRLIFEKEIAFFRASDIGYYGGSKQAILAKDGDTESKLPLHGGTSSISSHIVRYIKDWKVYHFHDTSASAKVKLTCNINDCEILAQDGANLAAFLRNIREHNLRSYTEIVKTVQRVAPFFHDFILEPEVNNQDTIKLKWKHKGTDEYFDANDLSDGTLRFICLTTLLLQPNLPTIILLDEPELGLHPFALQLLASMFKKISKKTQIIASTQSVTLTDNFDIEDIIVVNRKDNCSDLKRLKKEDYKEWLKEYSLGEIWQKNIIGGVPSYD